MKGLVQVGRYGTVAVQASVADWAVFATLLWFGADELMAQAVARLVGAFVSFTTNKLWSFEAGGRQGLEGQLRRFGALYVVSFVLNLSLLALGLRWLGLSPWVSKAIADTCGFFLNFAVMRWWVFREEPDPGS